jgi:hypothetical protein
MGAIGQYDCDLQMFVDAPRTAEYRHLLFLRWLVTTGRLDGDGAMVVPPRTRRIPLLDYTGATD